MLACLEGTSLKAQAALESGANLDLRMEAGSNLGSYFQKASTAFFDKQRCCFKCVPQMDITACSRRAGIATLEEEVACGRAGRGHAGRGAPAPWVGRGSSGQSLQASPTCIPRPAPAPPPPPPPGPPQVRATMGKFEERLWSIVRNFLRVAKEDPELLVTALQVCMPVLWLCTCDCLYSKTETQRAGAA